MSRWFDKLRLREYPEPDPRGKTLEQTLTDIDEVYYHNKAVLRRQEKLMNWFFALLALALIGLEVFAYLKVKGVL